MELSWGPRSQAAVGFFVNACSNLDIRVQPEKCLSRYFNRNRGDGCRVVWGILKDNGGLVNVIKLTGRDTELRGAQRESGFAAEEAKLPYADGWATRTCRGPYLIEAASRGFGPVRCSCPAVAPCLHADQVTHLEEIHLAAVPAVGRVDHDFAAVRAGTGVEIAAQRIGIRRRRMELSQVDAAVGWDMV